MLIISLLRGLFFYISVFAASVTLAWLILPWRYGIAFGSPHMMMAVAGGGAALVLIVIVLLVFATNYLPT